MKNLAIGLNSGTVEERNDITNLFSANDWAYWHWIDDMWIVQVPDEYTPKKLYNLIRSDTILGEKRILIFEFKGKINYWGWNAKKAWEWLSVLGKAN